MRKDYITSTDDADSSETDFVEAYWTANWEKAGGVEHRVTRFNGRFDRFVLKSEWRLMRPYLEKLGDSVRILDGGCGTGEWCRYLNGKGYRVVGMDISRRTVEQLNKLFPEDDFVVGDIRDTGQPDGQYDAMYSWGTFEHFENGLQPCVSEAFRLLRPGGVLFITVPFDSFGLALGALFDRVRPSSGTTNRRFYQWRLGIEELTTELEIGGFIVEKMRPIHRRQSIVRLLHHGFGLNYSGFVARGIGIALGMILPRRLCGHMLMAVARKPDDTEIR